MRAGPCLLCLYLLALPASAQRFAIGARGGVPLSERSTTYRVQGRMGPDGRLFLNPFTVGPAIETRLWKGFHFEAGALFKHLRGDEYNGIATAPYTFRNSRYNVWEFPLLLKIRQSVAKRQVFFSGGTSIRRLGHERVDELWVSTFRDVPSKRNTFTADYRLPVRYGLVVSAGTGWQSRYLHLEPEIRYTHWTSNHWLTSTNQVEFLLGISALVH